MQCSADIYGVKNKAFKRSADISGPSDKLTMPKNDGP